VNRLAASPLWTNEQRRAIYKRLGIPIEEDVVIGPACYFHSDIVSVGARTWINHGCHFEAVAPIEIGSDCGLSLYVTVLTSTHEVGTHQNRMGRWGVQPVKIGDGSWLGARVTVLPGVTIGDGCIIAAGALVKDDCEPDGLYAGVPARRIRDLEG
jgi:acetyltransferase-like isoleucine patch superfamily enzyme